MYIVHSCGWINKPKQIIKFKKTTYYIYIVSYIRIALIGKNASDGCTHSLEIEDQSAGLTGSVHKCNRRCRIWQKRQKMR